MTKVVNYNKKGGVFGMNYNDNNENLRFKEKRFTEITDDKAKNGAESLLSAILGENVTIKDDSNNNENN